MIKSLITITNTDGSPAPAGTVQVKDHYSGANLTLYEDSETSTKTNPATADSDGVVYFKVNDGIVDLVIVNGAFSKTIPNVQISDGGDLFLLENNQGSTINYGAICYLNASGKARLATNAGTEAQARARFICITRGNLANGAIGVFKGPGKTAELSGGTAAAPVYLGAAGGLLTTSLDPTDPSNAGKFIVPLGEYLSATALNFRPSDPVQI